MSPESTKELFSLESEYITGTS